ncbi:hypothetical protein DPV78_009905 [Talaromyces pinophilus]|nr:hypothetical protein DPV78_009905 [Talaromyces pinophilus]
MTPSQGYADKNKEKRTPDTESERSKARAQPKGTNMKKTIEEEKSGTQSLLVTKNEERRGGGSRLKTKNKKNWESLRSLQLESELLRFPEAACLF